MNTNMLWKKESELPNAVYVDIFKDVRFSRFYREATIEKSKLAHKDNGLSLKYRQAGNAEIERKNIKEAMELYNKSLCFAEAGSELASLAYANRSYCFLNLKMYQKCLSDIQLAKNDNYPEKLKWKLEQRESECVNRLKTADNKKTFDPTLSFRSDEKIPGMANAIKIERNEKFGRHIVAQCDIEEDKTVLIEEPMFKLLMSGEYKKCMVCLKENENLIPCTKCTTAIFCPGICSDNEFHKYECTMKNIKYFESPDGVKVRNSVRFAMQAVIKIIKHFSSTDEMIGFVQKCIEEIRNDPIEIAVTDGSAKSNFKTFMKLHHFKSSGTSEDETFAFYVVHACVAYETLMSYKDIEEKFSTTSEQRFLMHLMTQLIAIFKANNVLLREFESGNLAAMMSTDGFIDFGVALFNIGCYFNHSCLPNVLTVTNEKYSITKTIRPIKAGDQICIKYCVSTLRPTKERREFLLKAMGFLCNCELCLENGPTNIENPVMESAFRVLASHTRPLLFNKHITPKESAKIKKKLYEFLAKFRGMPTSEFAIMAYENLKMIYIKEDQNARGNV